MDRWADGAGLVTKKRKVIHLLWGFFDQYEKNASWSRLNKLGSGPLSKFSMLVPVFGALILFNEYTIQYTKIDPRFELLHFENPWRLICLYFGGFLYGIGSIWFSIRNTEAANYNTAFDYVNATRDYFSIPPIELNLMQTLLRENAIKFVDGTAMYEDIMTIFKEGQPVGNDIGLLCTVNYIRRNFDRPISRVLCQVLFHIGGILVAIPTAFTFFGIMTYTVKMIFR